LTSDHKIDTFDVGSLFDTNALEMFPDQTPANGRVLLILI